MRTARAPRLDAEARTAATTDAAADGADGADAADRLRRRRVSPAWRAAWNGHEDRRLVAAVAAVVAVGIWLCFAARSPQWLDEALAVDIASAPLRALPHLLREDGAPPLYYVLLHLWMHLFGTSDLASRSLSGAFGVIDLPIAWIAGYRLGARSWTLEAAGPLEADKRLARGRTVGFASMLLVATSPFVVYYDTEARMYALVLLLSTLGLVAYTSLLRRPGPARAFLLALDLSALLYSHYWALYVGAVLGIGSLWCAVLGPHRRACRYATGAVVLAALSFLPWLPTFLFQLRHTGTPWASPAAFTAIVSAATQFAGGNSDQGRALALVFFFLVVLALGGASLGDRHVVLDLRSRPGIRALFAGALGTLVLAIVAGRISGSTFADRYTAVVAVPAIIVVAYGLAALSDSRVRNGLLALALALGLAAAVPNAFLSRTQAGEVAAAITASARTGDVVAYCPDQLGPGVFRALSGPGLAPLASLRLRQLTFPRQTSPRYVDWIDYLAVVGRARPGPFVQRLLGDAAGGRTIYYVFEPGYLGYGDKCDAIADALSRARRMRVLVPQRGSDTPFEIFEGERLDSFGPK